MQRGTRAAAPADFVVLPTANHQEKRNMTIARLGTLMATIAGAVLLTGCVVAPVDGAYYTGDAYSTYSSGYGYGYSGYPYYGGSSLVIESSPTYVYGGGRPYYRPGGGYYRPGHGGYDRPSYHGNRPSYVSPGTGANIGRPIDGGGARPSRPSGGGSRFTPGYRETRPQQWQR